MWTTSWRASCASCRARRRRLRARTERTLAPYAVYNIGGGRPENLLDFVSTLQEELVRAGVLPEDYDFAAHRELVGMQPGDVPVTYADSEALARDYGFVPRISIREGLRAFAQWYLDYHIKGNN